MFSLVFEAMSQALESPSLSPGIATKFGLLLMLNKISTDVYKARLRGDTYTVFTFRLLQASLAFLHWFSPVGVSSQSKRDCENFILLYCFFYSLRVFNDLHFKDIILCLD